MTINDYKNNSAETMIDTSANDYQVVAKAIRYLEAHQHEQPSLEALAEHLGMSQFHLQRLFKRWAGISPKRFLQFLTVEHAKQLLTASYNVLDTTYATGLSSPGRLHDLFVTVEAMTPGEFKEGGRDLTIAYDVHPSPFGDCLLAITERGICGLSFLNGGGQEREIANMKERWPLATFTADHKSTAATLALIFPAGVSGLEAVSRQTPHRTRELRLLLAGTNFQVKVWDALLRIAPGSVMTYEEVAQAIDRPSAARAVGSAVGANTIAYLIPCHRVIRKSGLVHEYRWGATRKKAILSWEAAHR